MPSRQPDPMPVEALLEGYPPPMRAIAERLRLIVKRATPEASERVRVGWRLVAYDLPIKRSRAFFAGDPIDERMLAGLVREAARVAVVPKSLGLALLEGELA